MNCYTLFLDYGVLQNEQTKYIISTYNSTEYIFLFQRRGQNTVRKDWIKAKLKHNRTNTKSCCCGLVILGFIFIRLNPAMSHTSLSPLGCIHLLYAALHGKCHITWCLNILWSQNVWGSGCAWSPPHLEQSNNVFCMKLFSVARNCEPFTSIN